MLGNTERKTFLGISNGKVTYRPGQGQNVQTFGFVEGGLRRIERREATINGKKYPMYEFILVDGDETYDLSLGVSSSPAQHLINALATLEDPAACIIRISPWVKTRNDTQYTNVSVYADGKKLDWHLKPEQIPQLVDVRIGSNVVKDDSERVAMFEKLVDMINGRLSAAAPQVAPHAVGEGYEPEPEPEPEVEDMPEL